jgi:predicted nucleotidyltransferase
LLNSSAKEFPGFIHDYHGCNVRYREHTVKDRLLNLHGIRGYGTHMAMDFTNPVRLRLQDVFSNYPEILAVYLFGSHATATARPDSDYDFAVVSDRKRSARSRKLDILSDLAQIGFDNVDLAFLDRDNLVLSHEAVRMNRVIFSRPEFDPDSFYSKVIRMYFDFLPYVNTQRAALKQRILHGAT